MKKLLLGVLLLFAASCTQQHTPFALLPTQNFDTTLNGKAISLYTLQNGSLTMQVTNYGARVVSLWAPDRKGKYEDVVLGYQNIDRYINNNGERFLGAVVGRYANRIAKGSFTLEGEDLHASAERSRTNSSWRNERIGSRSLECRFGLQRPVGTLLHGR